MNENTVNEFDLIDNIAQSKDIDALYGLLDDSAFSIALHQILVNLYDANPNKLNKHQMNLFLSMHLENAGQSCSILGCLQEWFPQYLNKYVDALKDINAPNSALTIDKAIKLLPEDGSWFYDKADEKQVESMDQLDEHFSDYPDGNMPKLYRAYANRYKNEIVTWE